MLMWVAHEKFYKLGAYLFVLLLFDNHLAEEELLRASQACQPRVTVTSCFVYKVIRDFESIDHLCINTTRRIELIHKWSIDPR